MRVEFRTYVVERSRRWVEYIGMSFPDYDVPGSDGALLDTYATDVHPGQDVIVAGERPVTDAYLPGFKNTWPVARRVNRLSAEPLMASDALEEEAFWGLIRASQKASNTWDCDRLVRESLKKQGTPFALAFQNTLVKKCSQLVRERSISWGSAGLVVMTGPSFFDAVLAEEKTAPEVWGEPEFEDQTDTAEEVVGHPIHIDGFGTSRSTKRDPVPVVPPDWLDRSFLRSKSLGFSEWDDHPQRWVTFRFTVRSPTGLRESHVYVNRHYGLGFAQAAELAVSAAIYEGEEVEGAIECVDPRLVGMLQGMSPISYFQSQGQMSFDEFVRRRGYT